MIYIACPAQYYTGGPTLLHQLCYELNAKQVSAKMAYYHQRLDAVGGDPVHPRYKKYACDYAYLSQINFQATDWLVVPETATRFLGEIKNPQFIIWWLSVDNYVIGNLSFGDKIKKRLFGNCNIESFVHMKSLSRRYEFASEKIIHFAQSYYAVLFLQSLNIPDERIYFLSDYLDKGFIDAASAEQSFYKKDIILYNPKKMGSLTRKLLDSRFGNQMVPLENMSQEQLISTMSRSKIYIDFGNHPGKDRLPREAALCGCCVITGLLGSAANAMDVPIPERYKVRDNASIKELGTLIDDIFKTYALRRKEYDSYRNLIKQEYHIFKRDLEIICKCIFETDIANGS